ncbi:hypothetical protein [Campylobacter portucalensis]|uniref:hypothetical protein n=1 Tax=Campylobacter portucalensis TaxID=2608384 RepID=UPI0012B2B377|nr:hypothetical protein [Campylobacter portucalensis]
MARLLEVKHSKITPIIKTFFSGNRDFLTQDKKVYDINFKSFLNVARVLDSAAELSEIGFLSVITLAEASCEI